MKTILLSACAAALIATAGSSASAGQFTMNDNGPSGPIIGVGDSRYYDDNGGYGNEWRYPSEGYGDEDSDYGYGNRDYGYGNRDYGYGDNYGNSYGHGGYGYGNGGYGYGYGYGYGNYRVVPPYVIVRYLRRNDFSYITRPVLAGPYYQVKALDPSGRKVKLYVNAFNGRIVKVKY